MEQQQFDLAKQFSAIWRFKLVIALMVFIAGWITLGLTLMRSSVYQATATVMVESGETKMALPAEFELTSLQDIGSQIEVMRSRSVLERAINQLEPEKSANPQYLQLELMKLQDSLKIQQIRGTSLVALTIVSSDPLKAQKQADAVAEAYVYEANRARLTTIETSLENTTKQLKELTGSKVDISISPSFTRLTAQVDTALVTLEEVSKHLKQIGLQDSAGSLILNMNILQRVGSATSDANQLSVLVENLGGNAAVIESQTRALAIKLDALAAQVEAIRGMETDPQVHGKLSDIEGLIQVAGSTTDAVLQQVIAFSTTQIPATGTSPLLQNLPARIEEHTNLIVTSLESASEQLRQVATLTSQRIETLNGRVTSTTGNLQVLSQQLQPSAPEKGILLTHVELAAMETSARTVVETTDFLLSEVEKIRLVGFDPQVDKELLSVRELFGLARDATTELPSEIAGIAENGGGNLSYSALDNLRQELQLALLTTESSAIRVVDMAVVTHTSSIFVRYKNVILAIVAALLLGILSALVLQHFDRRVRDTSQAASYVGLPSLGQVAATTHGNPSSPSVLNKDASEYLEGFRILRTNLGLDSYKGRALLVSSPGKKEGKTTVAANLARVVALQGRKVLLIDGNMRNPDVAAAFGLTEEDDLSELLTSENEPWDYVAQAEGVDILASRTASAESAEILSSPRMKELLQKARETYDVVIVDSAPVIGYADTRILAREVDEALLVLRPDVSRLDLAKESKEVLETMGARVVGFALNKVRTKERKQQDKR